MLDLKFILQNRRLMEENCKKRNLCVDFDLIEKLANQRSSTLQLTEKLRAEINQISKEVGKQGKNEELILKSKKLKEESKAGEEKNKEINDKLKEELYKIPNLIHSKTPIGKIDKDNKEIEKIGKIPILSSNPKII